MNRKFIWPFLLLVFPLLFIQCSNDNDDEFSLGKVWISLGLIETENSLGYIYSVILDNGDTLLPASSSFRHFEPEHGKRVIANYTYLGRVGSSEKLYYAKINHLKEVLYKDLIALTEENADSLGNDPLKITGIWSSNNKLNVEFDYVGGAKTHFINLAYQPEKTFNENEPIELLLLHNSNNDPQKYLLNGLVSFNLDKLKEFVADTSKVSFVVKSTNFDGNTQSFTGTYSF